VKSFEPSRKSVKKDYACDPVPKGRGGYADVFRAVHKPTGTIVAFKRLHTMKAVVPDGDALPRMKREVEAMRALSESPHVMPVYDRAEDFSWYVMPLARGDLYQLRDAMALDEQRLVRVFHHVAAGLKAAHANGYVHRDITPQNLLLLDEPDDPWVVADWGLVRKPAGMTTTLLTSTGVIGTDGFLAPEVFDDPHNVTAAADIYSLGRVITWAITGDVPARGDRNPPPGAYRQLVRRATDDDPSRRPSLVEFMAELDNLMFVAPSAPQDSWDDLLTRANDGDRDAARKLVEAADERPDDADLYLDYLAKSGETSARQMVASDSNMALRIVDQMTMHMESNFGGRNYDYLNVTLGWILQVAQAAEAAHNLGLLEDVSLTLLEAEASCARFRQRDRTRSWLNGLSGDAALAVARALRARPAACEWLCREDWAPSGRADAAIRNVILQAQSGV
jgi:serine/threonine protein kinase